MQLLEDKQLCQLHERPAFLHCRRYMLVPTDYLFVWKILLQRSWSSVVGTCVDAPCTEWTLCYMFEYPAALYDPGVLLELHDLSLLVAINPIPTVLVWYEVGTSVFSACIFVFCMYFRPRYFSFYMFFCMYFRPRFFSPCMQVIYRTFWEARKRSNTIQLLNYTHASKWLPVGG